MAEIRIERKRRGLLPWIVGLALLALVVAGLLFALGDRDNDAADDRPAAAGNVQDDTPRHLRQYAVVVAAGAEARAA